MLWLLGKLREARNVRVLGRGAGKAFSEFEEECAFSYADRERARRVFAWLVSIKPEHRLDALKSIKAYFGVEAYGIQAVQKWRHKSKLLQNLASADSTLRQLPPECNRANEVRRWIGAARCKLETLDKEIEEDLEAARKQEIYFLECTPFAANFMRMPTPSPSSLIEEPESGSGSGLLEADD